MTSNGCNEDGFDLYEAETKQEFEFYAVRYGYDLEKDDEVSFFYKDPLVQSLWEAFHKGHIMGRDWNGD